jgi:hypothetical protein
LAAENLMLAAYAAGLGTCWTGFAQTFLNTPDGKNVLGRPAAWVSVAPNIVGDPKRRITLGEDGNRAVSLIFAWLEADQCRRPQMTETSVHCINV